MPGRLVWAWYILAVPPSSRGAHFFAAENLVCLILRWTWRLGFEKRLALIHFIFHHSLFVPRLIFSLLFMYGSATACILSLRTSILDCGGCRSPLPPLLSPPPHTHTNHPPINHEEMHKSSRSVFSLILWCRAVWPPFFDTDSLSIRDRLVALVQLLTFNANVSTFLKFFSGFF